MAIFSQLDNFQKMYIQNMDSYRALVDPILCFNHKLKYYVNVNNISMKLLAETKRRSVDWYLDLKKTLAAVGRLANGAFSPEMINRSSNFINEMIKDLPVLR